MTRPLLLILIGLINLISQKASAQIIYPDRIEGDSLHAPFYHGVASGDPLTDRVIIWTRITPATLPSAPIAVNWTIATDSLFTQQVQTGVFNTDSLRDWTVKIDVAGLQPYTHYFYRFEDGSGAQSAIGRTKTAPDAEVSPLRFGIGSCSSVWSGYFNAYRRMGERDNIDLLIHLGDFVYDNTDPDELIRIPTPPLPQPGNLTDWRNLHQYYCLDVDFRFMKQQHPMAVLWDNHDLSGDSISQAAAIQTWWEWTPARMPDSLNPRQIYRTLHYGPMADIFFVDVLLYRDTDTLADGEPVFIGDTEFAWITNELANSTAKWKLFANENMMSQFSLATLPPWLPLGDGPVLDSSVWDGYNSERLRVLDFIESQNIDNVIVLSGDSHLPFTADLDQDPWDAASYDGNTGAGAVAVEFLPCSISRGNIDEMGLGFGEPIIQAVAMNDNPHHVYTDFTSHGYGLLNLKSDSAVAEFWFSEILTVESTEDFAGGWVVHDGDNHWSRTPTTTPVDCVMTSVFHSSEMISISLYPNPTTGNELTLAVKGMNSSPSDLKITDALGRNVDCEMHFSNRNNECVISIHFGRPLQSGIYFVSGVIGGEWISSRFVVR